MDKTYRSDREEFAALIREAGWSLREVARRLRTTETTPRQWASGRQSLPPTILPWIRDVVDGIRRAGAPEGWRYGAPPSE